MKLRYGPGRLRPRTPCGGRVIAFKWPERSPPPKKSRRRHWNWTRRNSRKRCTFCKPAGPWWRDSKRWRQVHYPASLLNQQRQPSLHPLQQENTFTAPLTTCEYHRVQIMTLSLVTLCRKQVFRGDLGPAGVDFSGARCGWSQEDKPPDPGEGFHKFHKTHKGNFKIFRFRGETFRLPPMGVIPREHKTFSGSGSSLGHADTERI